MRRAARLACQALGVSRSARTRSANGFNRVDALTLLEAHGESAKILVVGHEPSFSQVVYDFTGGRVDFKKGAVAALDARRTSGHAGPGCARTSSKRSRAPEGVWHP